MGVTATTTLAEAVYASLSRDGPATAGQLAARLGSNPNYVQACLVRDPRLCVVGKGQRRLRKGKPPNVWGVRTAAPANWAPVFKVGAVRVQGDGDAELTLFPVRDAGGKSWTVVVAPADWPGKTWPPRAGVRVRLIPARVELVDAEDDRG